MNVNTNMTTEIDMDTAMNMDVGHMSTSVSVYASVTASVSKLMFTLMFICEFFHAYGISTDNFQCLFFARKINR